jgi:hypothetical protein
MERRDFLRTTTAAALGGAALGGVAAQNTASASAQVYEPALTAGRLKHPERPKGPIDIGDHKQLWLDDLLVAETTNVHKYMSRVRKYQQNPILVPDRPWERGWTGSDGKTYLMSQDAKANPNAVKGYRVSGLRITGQTALYDEEEKLFKIWYGPWLWPDARQPWCYAVSSDGFHWEKPDLGIFEYEGSKKNNILYASADNTPANVIKDLHDPDPQRRYKAMGELEPQTGRQGVSVAFSPDGIHWTHHPEPVVAKGVNMTDAPTMLGWDRHRGKYVGYFRPGPPVGPDQLRTIGYSESDDFMHWTDTKLMLSMDKKDRPDYEYMQFTAAIDGDFYIGQLMMYERHTQTWSTYLLSSRDGFHWTWVNRCMPFLARGEVGSYDDAYQTPCGPIVHNGTIWIYYGCFTAAHSYLPSPLGLEDTMTVAVATLPADRYAGLLTGADPGGTILTQPLKFQGSKLMVDLDGSLVMLRIDTRHPYHCKLRAALLDESGGPIERYSADRCEPVYESGRQELRWRDANVGELSGKPIRIRFQYQNAVMYSFQFIA